MTWACCPAVITLNRTYSAGLARYTTNACPNHPVRTAPNLLDTTPNAFNMFSQVDPIIKWEQDGHQWLVAHSCSSDMGLTNDVCSASCASRHSSATGPTPTMRTSTRGLGTCPPTQCSGECRMSPLPTAIQAATLRGRACRLTAGVAELQGHAAGDRRLPERDNTVQRHPGGGHRRRGDLRIL